MLDNRKGASSSLLVGRGTNSWRIKNQLDVTYFISYRFNIFRTLLCRSSGVCDYAVELPLWSLLSVKVEEWALVYFLWCLVVCVWCAVFCSFVVVSNVYLFIITIMIGDLNVVMWSPLITVNINRNTFTIYIKTTKYGTPNTSISTIKIH